MRLILLMKDVRMGSLKRKRGTFMENKVHFKLHKVKNNGLPLPCPGLALWVPSLIWSWSSSADEQATNQVTSASTPESVSQDPDHFVTETTVATAKADQVATNSATDTTATVTTDKQPVLKEDQASSTYNLSSGETRTATSTSETASTVTEVNSQAPESVETTVVSGGQFKSDAEGNWYYLKDGKKFDWCPKTLTISTFISTRMASKPRVRLSQKMDNLSTMTKPMDVR